MSAFALPMPPEALTGVPSSAYGTLRYRRSENRTQTTEYGYAHDAARQGLQLLRDDLIFVSPIFARFVRRYSRDRAHSAPKPASSSDDPTAIHQKAFKFRFRSMSGAQNLPRSFAHIGLRSPPHLIAQRYAVRSSASPGLPDEPPSDNRYARSKTSRSSNENAATVSSSAHLSSVVCILFSATQSFGSWLEPRYIFGAETLI